MVDSLLKTVQEECEMLENKETQGTLLQLEIWKCLKGTLNITTTYMYTILTLVY